MSKKFFGKVFEKVESKVAYAPCHEGNVKAFSKGLLTFYGGGTNKKCKYYAGMVVIDLANNFPPLATVTGLKMPTFLSKVVEKRIQIEWPDMQAGYLNREAWQALVADLKQLGKQDVLVCCMGGHGRTGTTLAILANLMLGEKEPIKFIRKVYCDHAVENQKQVEYINYVTGLQLTDNAYKTHTTAVTSYSYTGGTKVYDHESGLWIEEKGGATKVDLAKNIKEFELVTCQYCLGPKKEGVCLQSGKPEAECKQRD